MSQLGLFAEPAPTGPTPWRLFTLSSIGGRIWRTWRENFATEAEAKREGRRLRREFLRMPAFELEYMEPTA